MESAVGIVLKHWNWGDMVTQGRGRSGTEKGNTKFEKCRPYEFVSENVKVEGS